MAKVKTEISSNVEKNNCTNDTGNIEVAKIRVGARGGAYIPSEEIASLPEVKQMQQRAAQIVSRNRFARIASDASNKEKVK